MSSSPRVGTWPDLFKSCAVASGDERYSIYHDLDYLTEQAATNGKHLLYEVQMAAGTIPDFSLARGDEYCLIRFLSYRKG